MNKMKMRENETPAAFMKRVLAENPGESDERLCAIFEQGLGNVEDRPTLQDETLKRVWGNTLKEIRRRLRQRRAPSRRPRP
jgi:hypothetical protein